MGAPKKDSLGFPIVPDHGIELHARDNKRAYQESVQDAKRDQHALQDAAKIVNQAEKMGNQAYQKAKSALTDISSTLNNQLDRADAAVHTFLNRSMGRNTTAEEMELVNMIQDEVRFGAEDTAQIATLFSHVPTTLTHAIKFTQQPAPSTSNSKNKDLEDVDSEDGIELTAFNLHDEDLELTDIIEDMESEMEEYDEIADSLAGAFGHLEDNDELNEELASLL